MPVLILAILVLLALGYMRFTRETGSQHPPSEIHLKSSSVYRIKKKQELMGMRVTRIISRQQPEEFLLVDGVSRQLADSLYAKEVDLAWANLMAQQFIRLREGSVDEGRSVSIEILDVKTLESGTIQHNGRNLPYWQLQVSFRVNHEDQPRHYNARVVRHIRPAEGAGETDTLLIAYAQREAFEEDLLADLLRNLDFAKR